MILRQLSRGQTRFSELRESLGIAPNLLSARLRTLTEAGVVETAPYQEIGARQGGRVVRLTRVLTAAMGRRPSK
ncbi:winged helix-turn-helix transcriptional regulator [Amycolatopsis sp. NPDC051372]|uniref:winged helix-turn-helix transcriptional regulator n=1 Tax=Amycolatopsis sp. NPDC051372 TaxID=3155669 RepID=UPI00343B3B6B